MHKPQHPKLELTAEAREGVAYIKIQGHLHEFAEANSVNLSSEVDGFIAKGIKNCELYLSTGGGSVFVAIDMVNHLNKFDSVNITGGAVIASAGTYFLANFHSKIYKNTQVMVHKPMAGVHGNQDEWEARKKMLDNATADYLDKYVKKTGKTEAQITALWNKGDHWMTAEEAKKEGFVNEVIGEEKEIDTKAYLGLVACGAPNAEAYKPKNTNKRDMNTEQLAAMLGLPATATEAEVTAKIEALKISQGTLEQIQAQNQAAEATAQTAAIKTLLDAAEQKKQITAAQRPHYEQLATANFESCKAVLETIPEGGSGVSAQLDKGKGAAAQGEHDFVYYQEHPKAWAELEANDPEKAKALAEAHYSELD